MALLRNPARHGLRSLAWVGVLVAALWPGAGTAQPVPAVVPVPAATHVETGLGTAEAAAWLARIQAAAQTSNFRGTMVYSTGGRVSSSRVAHYVVGDQVYELLEALDGRQQRTTRHNDAVQTVWPQTKTAVFEKRETLAAWSTTPQRVLPQALAHYSLRREVDARAAGRDAAVLLMEPRDALRHAQRLWVDLASGLLLRADALGPPTASGANRALLESTAFSEIAIDVKPQLDDVLQGMKAPPAADGWRLLRPPQQRSTLEQEGWVLAHAVPGYQLAGVLRRGLATGADDVVVQAVFSDGLTHVSVFVEHYGDRPERQEMQAQQGATATLSRRRGEHWVTVVGDVPVAALQRFVQALERRRP